MPDGELTPPPWLTRIIGEVTDEQWTAIQDFVDNAPPLSETQRDRLRLIFRAPPGKKVS